MCMCVLSMLAQSFAVRLCVCVFLSVCVSMDLFFGMLKGVCICSDVVPA